MLVYWCKGGPFLGFYKELGSTVRIAGTRKLTRTVQVWHTEMVEIRVPVHHDGLYLHIPGHYEDKMFWVPEEMVTKTRTVPEHYEKRTETTPAHWGTREYWLEPQIEIRYRFVGTAEQRAGRAGWELIEGEYVFVGTSEQRAGRAGWESYEEVIPGCWQERRIWFPDVTRTYTVWVPEQEETYVEIVPEHYEMREVTIPYWSGYREILIEGETKMIEKTWYEWEEVEVDDPIFAYADPPNIDNYELVDKKRGYVWPPEEAWDTLKIRNVFTGEIFEMKAEYVGCAQRIGDNEFVVPEED